MADVQLDQIHGDLIKTVWPLLEPFIARSLVRSPGCDLTPEFVREKAEEGRFFLWAIYEREKPIPLLGAVVTGLRTEDGISICECFAMSGRGFASWSEKLLLRFEAMAREHGVQKLVFSGRRGCQRSLAYRRLGFELVGDVMEKYLG